MLIEELFVLVDGEAAVGDLLGIQGGEPSGVLIEEGAAVFINGSCRLVLRDRFGCLALGVGLGGCGRGSSFCARGAVFGSSGMRVMAAAGQQNSDKGGQSLFHSDPNILLLVVSSKIAGLGMDQELSYESFDLLVFQ